MYIKIKNIEKTFKRVPVYDIIGVKDNHNFIANNMVVHNCDEAIRFACLDGETKIHTREGLIQIKDLVNKKDFKVLTYDEKQELYSYKKAEKCIPTKIDYVYELETEYGKTIRCTKEHKFLTKDGWKELQELIDNDILINDLKIKSITKKEKIQTYDIINVEDNNNYLANGFVVHNSSEDWNKRESKQLKKKLAQIRTKHLLFILCFPLKISKVDKTYLEAFVNVWIDIFGRGIGAIYIKDRNPVNDSWRMKDFKNVGSYTEFTSLQEVEKKLKKHPNFWQIIRFPKPPAWLYDKYLAVREKNVYDDESLRQMVTTEDIHRSLLLLALQDIMMNDTTLNMNRIALHIKNNYDIPITKTNIQNIIVDAKQMVTKIREEKI